MEDAFLILLPCVYEGEVEVGGMVKNAGMA